ncbi:MAG: hypothetical protein FHOMOCKG_00025 [Methanophagales virus GBV302]|uniref:Uncharacterized protein n=1 Tax=Methanophagales virus GBV302 TaxID=2999281 RepID=A0A9E8VBN6_9CAUD|nr:MAG: hypothetical protein QIT37_gp025 [Methanophagales virus GBV302]WAE39553.1 MAG: hypothetical protein FHOMOCKG_00025 [Methanophagales virus GBV302]
MFNIFKKEKEKERGKIEVVFEFRTKKGWSALVETGKFWKQEISFDVPILSKSEFETLLDISSDLNNKKYLHYFLFSLIHPFAVPSTHSFYLCRLEDVWTRVSSKEYYLINLKCSMLDVIDYTEMENILNKQQFWHVCGLVLKSHKKANPNEIKEIGSAYLFLDGGVLI